MLQRSVFDGEYKMIYYPKIKKTRLYNIKTDPHEMTDLAANPNQAQRLKELRKKLKALQTQTGDTLKLEF